MEIKDPNRIGAIAKQQAYYYNIVNTRGIYALQLFGVKDLKIVYYNNMYTITLAYNNTTSTLQLFINYLIFFAKLLKYYITQVKSFTMTDTIKIF